MKPVLIYANGINFPSFLKSTWHKEAEERGLEFAMMDKPFYTYTSIKGLKRSVDDLERVLRKYEDRDDVYVIAYSFGGILFNCASQRVTKFRAKKIFFMASPLQMLRSGMKKRMEVLGYDGTLDYKAKIKSFGGLLDFVVPNKFTNYGDEEHFAVKGGHLYFILSKEFIKSTLDKLRD